MNNRKGLILVFTILFSAFTQAQDKKVWTLEECVNYALENNISVQQGENTLLINEQDVIANKGGFLPSVSGGLGERLTIGSGFDPVSNRRVSNQTTNSFSYNFSVNQNVFNGFRTLNIYKQSLITLERNELELKRIKDDISLNVVNTYLNVLFNKENLETAEAQVDFSQKQLDQVRELVDAGVQPRANIYDVEATLSSDEQNLTIAENNYNLALLSLSQLLQLPFDGFEVEIIEIDSPSAALMYNDISSILDYAYSNRYEIKVAEKDIENAILGREISKSGYYPSVGFSYGFGSVWSESKNDLRKDAFFKELDINKGHTLNLNVSIPIFSQYQNKTAVAQAQIREDNAKLNLEQAKLDLESNIQRAFTDAQAALKAYEAAKKSREAQQLAFQNSQERYNLGSMNSFDLEQSRIQLINAQSRLINAKYDFVFKTKVLDFYLGKPITQ
ncbi:TolC family protein [Hanstruepera neustonica]|uniref:TolC family protein n=1 Tax=Hanstruepera neustonica TaxID=1445657 RepID=A0A2K1E143_9FLAO|nr:TolC family protein [Hanstruepera neustonica]PNQ73996.1 TolC family protein [Hanstruepera neustonica]